MSYGLQLRGFEDRSCSSLLETEASCFVTAVWMMGWSLEETGASLWLKNMWTGDKTLKVQELQGEGKDRERPMRDEGKSHSQTGLA